MGKKLFLVTWSVLTKLTAMKKLLITAIVALLNFSCEDGCIDKRNEVQTLENHLVLLNEQKESIYKTLIDIDIESDPETINSIQMIEDELMMIMVDIAVTEINIEQIKKDSRYCGF